MFYFKAVLWESIILLLRPFPPLCKAYPIALLLSSPLPVFLANRRASLFFRTATHSSSGPSQLSPTGIHPPPLYFRTGARVCSSVPQPKGHTGGGGYPSPVLPPPPLLYFAGARVCPSLPQPTARAGQASRPRPLGQGARPVDRRLGQRRNRKHAP